MPKQDRFQEVKALFQNIFNPFQFSVKKALQSLETYGGITNILASLKVTHRQGLSNYENFQRRIKLFGSNVPPKGENIFKKSLIAQSDFTINLLLYILTLSICIKLLHIRNGLHVQTIFDEFISCILLLIMIFLKAMVNVQFFKLNQDQRKYKNQWVKVKRNGQKIQIKQQNLQVGDIMFVRTQDVIRIDGIILQAQQLNINQSQTILKQDSKLKSNIFQKHFSTHNQNHFDPFILAGSKVIFGKAQILICTIGQCCSFRVNKQDASGYVQSTPVVIQVRKNLKNFQNFSRIISFSLGTYVVLCILIQSFKTDQISWLTFLQILKTYSSFIGFICILQRLKVVRSLQFFLQSYRSGNNFRILQKKTIQKLNEIDLILVDQQTINIIKTQRQPLIPKLQFWSSLNKNYSVKIISQKSIEQLKEQFGQQINQYQFYSNQANLKSDQKLQLLKQCFFIVNQSKNKINSQLFPIFQNLQYNIAYISKFKSYESLNVPKNIMHITFNEQNFKFQNNQKELVTNLWLKIKNTPNMEDHLQQIIFKSHVFAKLYNVYMTLVANNSVVFIILCYISITRNYTIDFYWSLIVIIIARYTFFSIYNRIALQQGHNQFERRSLLKVFQYNFFLLPYYMYCVYNIQGKINIVLFFISNSTMRTQILLLKINWKKAFKNLLLQYLLCICLILGYLALNFFNQQNWDQELQLLLYVTGLLFLLILYGLICS